MNNLDLMRARLNVRGGEAQQDRMIKDKRESFDKAVLYSYQGARVQKVDSDLTVRALINPNVVKQDYDDKIISVGYEHAFKPGDIFEWKNTQTKWLIYLQDLTELAYFKGDIRKCNYEIKWQNAKGEQLSTYAAIRGPVETKIDSVQKAGLSIDLPNHTLSVLTPLNIDTLEYFKRYSKFYLQDSSQVNPVCWRVEATDTVSMPGILQFTAVEYYSNEHEDDIEQGIVDAFVPLPPEPVSPESLIQGEIFIKPFIGYEYTYTGADESSWTIVNNNAPVEIKSDGKTATITWTKTYGGKFVLQYGNSELEITINSLF